MIPHCIFLQCKKLLYSILLHIYGIQKDCNDNPVCETAKETQMQRTVFWILWGRGMIWENGIETHIVLYMKQVASFAQLLAQFQDIVPPLPSIWQKIIFLLSKLLRKVSIIQVLCFFKSCSKHVLTYIVLLLSQVYIILSTLQEKQIPSGSELVFEEISSLLAHS